MESKTKQWLRDIDLRVYIRVANGSMVIKNESLELGVIFDLRKGTRS